MTRGLRLRLALLIASIALTACARPERTIAPQDTPVFIISIDTLRSDHLPAYGYRAGSTPSIDRLRADSILYRRAFSHCPQTLPSHTAVFTGLLPPDNGVRDNVGYALIGRIPTLPQILKDRGYATGAAVSSYVLRRSTGIARGFDFYDDEMDPGPPDAATSSERNGDRTRATLERWLDRTPGDRVFGFLHLYEPHAPYTPPKEFAAAATPYDGEIAYADLIAGRFLDHLKQHRLYDRALIILMSDHGEGLGDHGEDEHGIFVYRESLQVPLLIKLPQSERRGTTIEDPVGLSDIAPTILTRLGIDLPRGMGRADLLGKLSGTRRIFSESYFARLHFGWHELTALTGVRFQFIEAPRRELYDYVSDRRETRNVADSNRRLVAGMAAELQNVPLRFEPPSSVDPEDQRRLAALGYVGSAAATGALPDPKDRIGFVRRFRHAVDTYRAGHDAQAIAELNQLLSENPSMVDAWGVLARAYRRQRQPDLALAALRTAMRRFPNDANVALALADLLFSMGDYEGARQHAQLAISGNAVLAHESLARMALERGALDEAERQGSAALAEAPNRAATLLLMAQVRNKQQRYQDELALLDRAAAEIDTRHLPPAAGLQAERGQALLEMHQGPEAEEAFTRETKLFPQELHAWANLALLRAAKGDVPGARATLEEMIRINPGPGGRAIAAEAYDALGDRAAAERLRHATRP
jgi:choline-sulfatase